MLGWKKRYVARPESPTLSKILRIIILLCDLLKLRQNGPLAFTAKEKLKIHLQNSIHFDMQRLHICGMQVAVIRCNTIQKC